MSEYFSGSKRILKGTETVPDRRGGSRRLHQRFHVNIETIVECGKMLYKGAIIDISKKGCRVIFDKEILTVNDQITLKFIVPGDLDERNIKGKIKWKAKKENIFFIGIEFERPQNI